MGFGRDGGSHVTTVLESSGSYAEGSNSPGAKLRYTDLNFVIFQQGK